MKALIFAAGLGTRLRPLTDHRPKALVNLRAALSDGSLADRPLLWWTERRLEAAGVDEIVINVHHFASMVREYVKDENSFGIKVTFSDETSGLLDTGGGMLKALPLLLGDNAGAPFAVHNVDIVSNLNYREFFSQPMDGILARLVVCDRPSNRKLLFDKSMRLRGWTDLSTGAVKGPAALMRETDRSALLPLSFAGIHLVSQDIARVFVEYGSFSGAFSIIDFYLAVCDKYPIFGHLQPGFCYVDAGCADRLGEAALLLERTETGQ